MGWGLGRRLSERLITCWPVQPRAHRHDAACSEPPCRPPAELCFLHWDDIARAHWPRQPHVVIAQALIAGRWYLLQGGIFRVARLCPGVALCGAYPLIWLALTAGLAESLCVV